MSARNAMATMQSDFATPSGLDNAILVPTPSRPVLVRTSVESTAVLERAGPFEIRLASSEKELRSAQKLRYTVFYEEGGAIANRDVARSRRDICPFDAICDHLIIVDTDAVSSSGNAKAKVVGTYRLLRRDVAEAHNGFYSQGEFDMQPLLDRQPTTRFLELGRSCVHMNYRSKRVIELLWRGLWLYAKQHKIDALLGCASLPGTDLDALRLPLSFLHHYAQADEAWQVEAWPHGIADFTPLPKDAIDVRRGITALPPLFKAYLRTGARFGRHAVIDRQFGTTDVFTVMPMGDIEERYIAHYGEPSCVSGAPVA
ncbi:GNAT family N-acetyltransferase [Beijerinckia sp. L45]|uniref:GNAT family N-acetyltransferase n=1 Tax=Beijerinckia sp. L45 TaxID=1641855 RepID=UPI00131BF4CD|nr:GNAT family N-acyltransferase [Beijerinckia sp. L45]